MANNNDPPAAQALNAAERERLERFHRFKFDKFDPNVEDFDYYIQRFELELTRFRLDDDVNVHGKRTLLLTSIGPDAYRILVDHFRPDPVMQQTYNAVKEALQKYYVKQICTMAERVKFTQRIRKEEETIPVWINSLRAIAGHCNFGNSLQERLRDQLFMGINNATWQKELFRAHPLDTATFTEVEATALILEKASAQQQRLQSLGAGSHSDSNVRRVGHTSQQPKARREQHSQLQLQKGIDCFKCGNKAHKRGDQCPAQGAKCKACGNMNHFAKVCIKKGHATIGSERRGRTSKTVNTLQQHDQVDTEGSDTDLGTIHTVSATGRKAYLDAVINGRKIRMLYDPGAAQTVISESTWKSIGSPQLTPAASLVAYTHVPVHTLGKGTVTVRAFQKTKQLQLYVVKEHDTPLFGMDWCITFGLQLPKGVTLCAVEATQPAKNANTAPQLQKLLDQFSTVFDGQNGTINGHQAVAHMKANATPKVFSPRTVPFAIQKGVEQEIERLLNNDVLEPVDSTITPIEWASPVVCVVKPTGAIRICADFKVTINPHIITDPHPLPTFEQIATKLNGGRYFTKIDLRDAYLQLPVQEASRKYLVIATHKGYFRYKRLPFGISFAPALFQKTMEKVLAGLEGTAVYIDDIIICGTTQQEHLQRLNNVLERLQKMNIKSNMKKCEFLKTSVTYLGHRIDSEGIHPTDERIEAISKLPTPTNVQELRSFLGSINYYAKFIPRLQPLCTDLHKLTEKNAVWKWTAEHERRVQKLKQLLTSNDTLVHYDTETPIVLATDASDKGLGAVLMHRFPDGFEKPIAFVSRTISDSEKSYAPIDKEALAIVFGVTRFHQYIYGRRFTLKTDHKPLERIFGEQREIPKLLNNRLTRWALTLSAYNYNIQHIQGINNAPADMLSRLPIQGNATDREKLGTIYQLLNLKLEDLPVTKAELQRQTTLDSITMRVIAYIERGWPKDKHKMPQELHTFYDKRQELSYEDRILLWQGRIVVPQKLRSGMLQTLHEGHPGSAAMKAMARFYVWWPRIDDDIERYVRQCDSCQETRPKQPEVPLFSWSVPSEPWARIHIDYAEFEGKNWLIVVDAYTKWLEVKPTRDTSTTATVKILRSLFAQFGIPRTIVSDNGPQFASAEFKEFCNLNGIKQIRSTPYHPKTNGLAERAVRTFKERMTASRSSKADQDLRLQRFLISYRNTPHNTTGKAPAELMFGHRLRTKLDLLKPNIHDRIDQSLYKQKLYHDQRSKPRTFYEGENVWVQRKQGKGYDRGRIQKRTAEYSYIVNINGQLCRKHADHLRAAEQEAEEVEEQEAQFEEPVEIKQPPIRQEVQQKVTLPVHIPQPQPVERIDRQPVQQPAVQETVEDAPALEEATHSEVVNAESQHQQQQQLPVPGPAVKANQSKKPKPVLPPREPSTRIRRPVTRPYDDYITGKKLK